MRISYWSSDVCSSDLVPNYMVPQAIMLLDEVPLSPVGKLDRSRLPEPVFTASGGYRAPVTAAEMALCAVFTEVLGVERVGVDDGFFEQNGRASRRGSVFQYVEISVVDGSLTIN